jgi:hypothetical protein
MGNLLFVNTSRVNGIFGVVLCTGVIAAGLWFGLGGDYAWLLVVPVGLFAGKFCLKMATLRTELYEQGFVSKSAFGSASGRYEELKSISRSAVRTNGVLMTQIFLVKQSGEKVMVTTEALRKHDKPAQLLQHACGALATNWMKVLERQKEVPWMIKDSKPFLRIRKDGVLLQGKTGVDEFIPLKQLHLKSGFAMMIEVWNDNRKIDTISSAGSNYFVGATLIDMLIESQLRPTKMSSLEAAAR